MWSASFDGNTAQPTWNYAANCFFPIAANGKSYNLFDLEKAISESKLPLGVNLGQLNLEDIAPRPGSDELYVALSYGVEKKPLLVRVRVTWVSNGRKGRDLRSPTR